MILPAFRVGQAQDEHMFGHPAFLPRDGGADAQGEAFFPQQRIAAIAEPYDQMSLSSGKWLMYFWSIGAQGQEHPSARLPGGLRCECRQGMKSPFLSRTPIPCADAGHDVHIADDIRAVGDFDADFRSGRPMGPMEKGMTYIVRPFMQPLYSAAWWLSARRVYPVVGRAGFVLIGVLI